MATNEQIIFEISNLLKEALNLDVRQQSPTGKGSGSSVAEKSAATHVSSFVAGAITEDEIRNVILSCSPITIRELVAQFRPRLRNLDDKNILAEELKRISKIQNYADGSGYIVLKEN